MYEYSDEDIETFPQLQKATLDHYHGYSEGLDMILEAEIKEVIDVDDDIQQNSTEHNLDEHVLEEMKHILEDLYFYI